MSDGNTPERQAKSLKTATRVDQPWTPEEDLIVMSDRTLDQMALDTNRTYWGVHARRQVLGVSTTGRRRDNDHNQLESRDRILCPCGADVGAEHEDWCPDGQ